MSGRLLAVVLVFAVVCGVAAAGADDGTGGPQIIELYPNPVTENNTGEYILVEFPEPTNTTGWTLTDDGRQEAQLPNETLQGEIALSFDPSYTRNHTSAPVVELEGWLQPAASGDRIELRQNGTIVDAVEYDRAPESHRFLRADGGQWVPMGATDHRRVTTTPSQIEPFVLPDADDRAAAFLRGATNRLLVGAYTFTSDEATEALLDAHDRGVDVQVLADGRPVGGITDTQHDRLDQLVAAEIPVTVLGGDHARYRFHHAKYAVADDQALVLTENWKPSGTEGKSSRGWGVIIDDAETADSLASVFEADTHWKDGIPWEQYRSGVDTVTDEASEETYPSRFSPEPMAVDAVDVLVAPDNAEETLIGYIEDAEDSIRIQQVSIGGSDSALVAATIDAARRGVEVELLPGSAWYVDEENREHAAELERLAEQESLDLTVELVDPRSRFNAVHTKGAVIDDYHVVLGSINWNDHSLRENREVAVVLSGDEVADYYGTVLTADRRGGHWRLPYGLVAVLFGSVGTAVAICWRALSWRPQSQSSCSPAPDRCQPAPSSQQARQAPHHDDQ